MAQPVLIGVVAGIKSEGLAGWQDAFSGLAVEDLLSSDHMALSADEMTLISQQIQLRMQQTQLQVSDALHGIMELSFSRTFAPGRGGLAHRNTGKFPGGPLSRGSLIKLMINVGYVQEKIEKSHVRASVNSKIFPGVTPRTPI